MNRSQMFEYAKVVYSQFGACREGWDVYDHIMDRVEHFPDDIYAAFNSPDIYLMSSQPYLWAHYGFRAVEIGHKSAAMLMLTRVNSETAKEVRPPWPAFLVAFPSGLLKATAPDGETDLSYALVSHRVEEGVSRWSAVIFTTSLVSTSLWTHRVPADQLCDFEDTGEQFGCPPLTTLDERSAHLAWRFILGVCLLMQEPKNYRSPKVSSKKARDGRESPLPIVRTYVIDHKPREDYRPQVKEYLSSGRSITVQTLVCGHWKGQPYGTGSQLRKHIWIEPYWRGPEDAPILVRARAV